MLMKRITGEAARDIERTMREQGKRHPELYVSGTITLSKCLDEGDWHVVVYSSDPELLMPESVKPLVQMAVPSVRQWEVVASGAGALHFWEVR